MFAASHPPLGKRGNFLLTRTTMKDSITPMRCLAIFLCLVFASTLSHAAAIGAGVDAQVRSKKKAEADKFTREFEDHKNSLTSPDAYTVMKAMQFINVYFDKIVALHLFTSEMLDKYISALSTSTENIRYEATMFIDHHIAQLVERQFFTEKILSKYSNNVYYDSRDYQTFLVLARALLKKGVKSISLSPEHGYLIVDGLLSNNARVRELSMDILSHYGTQLSELKVVTEGHVLRFSGLLKDLPKENQSTYLAVLEKNFTHWVGLGLYHKKDVQQIISYSNSFSQDLIHQLYDFISRKDTIESLKVLGMFDREWAAMFKSDILGDVDFKKQNSLNVMAYLLPAFAQGNQFTKADFNEVWQSVEDDLDGFDDPFLIVRLNFKNLTQLGWFSRQNFDKMLAGFDKRSANSQEKILSFIDDVYDWIRLRDWLSITPLAKALLETPSTSSSLESLKLNFLAKHDDLVREGKILDQNHVNKFLGMLNNRDPNVFDPALKITQSGYATWISQGLLTTDKLIEVLGKLDPQNFKSAQVMKLFDKNLLLKPEILTPELVLSLSQFINSTQPKVSQAALDLFTHHLATLSKNNLIHVKTRKILREAGFFEKNEDDELPK